MSKVVILGSNAAALSSAEKIRSLDESAEIVMFALEGLYPYNNDLFPELILNKIPSKDVFLRTKDFYERQHIDIILDKKITRINFKRKKIFTETKEQIGYDVLIIADLQDHLLPDIKGKKRIGAHGIKRLKDIEQIIKRNIFVDTVSVQADSIAGLNIANAISDLKKDVYLILSDNSIWNLLSEEALSWISDIFKERQIKFKLKNKISEILGDSDVKAVRLSEGMVIESQMALFEDTAPDFRCISDSLFDGLSRLPVNEKFQTEVDNVYAIGDLCELNVNNDFMSNIQPLDILTKQGNTVGNIISGHDDSFKPELNIESFTSDELSIVIIGKVNPKNADGKLEFFDKDQNMLKLIALEENVAVGSVLINADDFVTEVIQYIRERKDAGELQILFPQMQYVEFSVVSGSSQEDAQDNKDSDNDESGRYESDDGVNPGADKTSQESS